MERLACMGALRLSMYLREEGVTGYWSRFPRLLDCEITADNLKNMEDCYFKSLQAEKRNSMSKLYKLLSPTDKTGYLAWCCLELAVLYYMNEQIGEVFEYIHSGGRKGTTIALASRILYGETAIIENPVMIKNAFSRCELLLQAEYPVKQMGNTLLLADDRLVEWMANEYSIPKHPFIEKKKVDKTMVSNVWDAKKQELLKEIRQNGLQESEEIKIVSIAGEPENGRSVLVSQLAEELGKTILMVNVSFLGSMESMLKQLRFVLREVLLTSTLICITDVEKRTSWDSMIKIIVSEYEKVVRMAYETGMQDVPSERPIFITCTESVKLVYLLKQD